MQSKHLQQTHLRLVDLTICLLFTIVPLFGHLPYRVNIFLSWEGAYRLYLGQIPFKDFSLPMGFGYWIIPFLTFKIFGPAFASLIKAQVFLNIISIASLRGLLYNLRVHPVLISLSLLVFCLSYVIYNFWPWYNHSVVVFELVSIYLLTCYICGSSKYRLIFLFLSALMTFLSFFTKQDVGALCFFICVGILIHQAVITKNYSPLAFYTLSFAIILQAVILPLTKYDFFYWFNFGQPPHNSRINVVELINSFLRNSSGEKIYLVILTLLVIANRNRLNVIFTRSHQGVLTIICVAMIAQACVTRVSSPLPTDHMSYFHTFGFVLIASLLDWSSTSIKNFVTACSIIGITFSAGYWDYATRLIGVSSQKNGESANEVQKKLKWSATSLEGFDVVLMPRETIAGIQQLVDSCRLEKNLKVLNMSELTPLALTLHYQPPIHQPLWYHLNIGMFQKEVNIFCERVKRKEYDLVLFEDIPDLTQFYPYQVRDTLRKYYSYQFSFPAPRKMENATIEVYSSRQHRAKKIKDLVSNVGLTAN